MPEVNVDILTAGDGQVVHDPLFSPVRCEKLVTLDSATENAWGDISGTRKAGVLFTVTGTVRLRIIGVCEATVVGAGKLEVGITGNTAVALAQIANTTTFDVNMTWLDSTPALGEGEAPVFHPVGGGLDIIQTVGTANITAGELDYYCFWRPLSSDGLVVTA